MIKRILWIGLLAIFMVACSSKAGNGIGPDSGGMGMGMGSSSGMMDRHHAQIPDEYVNVENPVGATEESIERGAGLYAIHCASCHGDGGMGDGPAGAVLDPAPSPIARTSQMMGDNYLFWRVSEGGIPFNTSMPAWKDTLDSQSRWDLINYVQALGAGKAKPASSMGGAMFDPKVQSAQELEILEKAIEQGVINKEEMDIFNTVHAAIEQFRTENPGFAKSIKDATEREAAMLAEVVKAGTISQAQADAFQDIHDRLGTAGLMP